MLGLMRVKVFGLHAEMQQRQRLKNLDRFVFICLFLFWGWDLNIFFFGGGCKRFRDTNDGVLIASDVAARGLDIPNVEHDVHYQLPRTAELYVHRSGRTARGSRDGVSVMLCSPEEQGVYKKICRTLKKGEGWFLI